MRVFGGPKVKITIEADSSASILSSILDAAKTLLGEDDGQPQAQVFQGAPRSSRAKPCNCTGERQAKREVSGVRRQGG